MPDQMDAIQSHRGDWKPARFASIVKNRTLRLRGEVTNAVDHLPGAVEGLARQRHRRDTLRMKIKTKKLLLSGVVLFCSVALSQNAATPTPGPEYTGDGQLKLPEHYREWVY